MTRRPGAIATRDCASWRRLVRVIGVPRCSSAARFGPAARCAAADRPFQERANARMAAVARQAATRADWRSRRATERPPAAVGLISAGCAGARIQRRRASSGWSPHPDRRGVPGDPASPLGVTGVGTARVGRGRCRRGPGGDVHARAVGDGLRRDVRAQPEGGAERLALTGPQPTGREAQPTARSATQTRPGPHEPQRARRPVARPQPAHRRVSAVSDADPVRDQVAWPREPRLCRLVDVDGRGTVWAAGPGPLAVVVVTLSNR